MAQERNIPRPTIERLPQYLYCLERLRENGVEVASSQRLGQAMGLKGVQIRKDLAYFGEFGQRGVGYNVESLIQHISAILGIGKEQRIAVVGAGHIGSALANYEGFRSKGFRIVAVFDNDPEKIGAEIGGQQVLPMEELERVIREEGAAIGIVAVPAQHAQEVAERLVSAGVRAIWNFAPVSLHLPKHVHVYQQNLSVGLLSLSFYLNRTENHTEE